MIVGFVTQTPSAFQDTELPNVGTINVTPRPQGPKLRFGPTDKLRVFFKCNAGSMDAAHCWRQKAGEIVNGQPTATNPALRNSNSTSNVYALPPLQQQDTQL